MRAGEGEAHGLALLAVETATEACSAALWWRGAVIERLELAPQRHGEHILALVAAVLAEGGITLGQLDGLAFGRGPGSFTGVRIAASVAQGLALAADLPVVPVSTLAALAQGALARRDAPGEVVAVAAALDARRGEVYWAPFAPAEAQGVTPLAPEGVCPPEAVARLPGMPSGVWWGVGSGWGRYGASLRGSVAPTHVDPQAQPRAAAVARLGALGFAQRVPAREALPVYLRNRVV